MKAFPDIAAYDFENIEFRSHLPNGFSSIANYIKKFGKKCGSTDIWLINYYKRNKILHRMKLGFVKTEKNCANIHIKIDVLGKRHKNTKIAKDLSVNSGEFLHIFRYMLDKRKKYRPMRVAYNFTRFFKEPLFPIQSEMNFILNGFKLQGTKRSPLEVIIVDQLRDGLVKVKIFSKPIFAFSKECIGNVFFKMPLKHMIDASDAIYWNFRKVKDGK